jgi:protease-4
MNDTPNWERQLVEKLAMAAVVEQRRARRWKIFFRLVWLGIIGGLLATAFLRNEDKSAEALTGGGHTAVISLEGVIDSENNTAEKLSAALEDAYNDHGTRGIIIEANSPGGSPVLSGMAYDEIRRLKKQHPAIPVYVTVQEVCASGCYYIAAAADKIFVDKASIIGSIGVCRTALALPA